MDGGAAIADDDQLVAVVAALGLDRLDVAEAVGVALGRPDVLGVLATRAGMTLTEDHFRIDADLTVIGAVPALVERGGRAASVLLRAEQRLEELGRLAMAASLPEQMRIVVERALRTEPPLVGANVLRSWQRSGVLGRDEPHARWLATACLSIERGATEEVVRGFDAVRQAFAARGEVEAEISAGLAAAVHARRIDDLATLAACAQRAEELMEAGHGEALAPHLLGRAIRHQILGEPAAALEALDSFPHDRLSGDWAAQVWMIRGANLMLLGRNADAVDALVEATGYGSPWSYAVALELLATARWQLGDAARALDDLRVSEQVARDHGAVPAAQLAAAHRRLLVATLGRSDDEGGRPPNGSPVRGGEELARMDELAEVLRAIAANDLAVATARIGAVEVPARPVRTAPWVVALRAALVPGDETLRPLTAAHESLAPHLAAGRHAAAHLAGGPPAPAELRPFLPAAWCEPVPPPIDLVLIGDATVRADGQTVVHPDWERARVRELCLHLVLVPQAPRHLVAMRLWPDLEKEAANRNLRVTRSYLMNVLEPDRTKGAKSDLLDDRAGMLGLSASPRLWIDVHAAADAVEQLRVGIATGDDAAVVRGARALVRLPPGDLLGGALPTWAEPFDTVRREAELHAVTLGAPRLLEIAQHDLAEALARRGLVGDRWAERLHQVVVQARLGADDLDGARRAQRRCLEALAELGITPEPDTCDLAQRLGLR